MVADKAGIEPLALARGAIKAKDGSWGDAQTLTLADGTTWRPHLANGRKLLAVHFEGELKPYLLKRLASAAADGYELTLAVPLGVLLDEDFLEQVAGFDVQVIVLKEDGTCEDSKALLRVLGEKGVSVGPRVRTILARAAYEANAADENPQSKGRKFEALLGFLLSQTDGLRVVEYNLRTASEELDLVVQLGSLEGPRCWCHLRRPFVLIEAKYWKDPVGQQVISAFQTKVAGKPTATKLGIVVARSGFTTDAQIQVIRFSLAKTVIVLISGEELEEWIDSEQPDEYLEGLVRKRWLD